MKNGLFLIVCAIAMVGVIGCGEKKPTTITSDAVSWLNLSQSQKSSFVKAEFKRLKYTGSYNTADVIHGLNQKTLDSSTDIREAIDSSLCRLISSSEKSNIKSMASDSDKMNELVDFEQGNDYSVLTAAKDTTDIKYFDSQLHTIESRVDAKKEAAAELESKIESCPLQIDKAWVKKDIVGTPEAYVEVWNQGNKTVDAYKVQIKCYDSFGDPVNDPASGDNIFMGIAQGVKIKPTYIYGDNSSWMLVMQDTTTKIKAIITEVHFTDGTTWSLNN